MSDLISRQAVIDLLKQMRKDGDMVPWEGKNVFDRIRKLPPAQPKRKKGQWIDKSNGIEGAWNYCSVCGEQAIDLYDFCPNCGADMRTKETDCDYERAVEQLEHDMLYEPAFTPDDGSM